MSNNNPDDYQWGGNLIMAKKKILVADDDKDIVEGIKFRLELEEFEVVTAYDGFEAFYVVWEEMPDLVILDVMMPHENGYRVSRSIKKIVKQGLFGKDIKILLLTARAIYEPERVEMFMEFSQADDMMYKPFEMDQLLAKIQELLA
jgi:two-component system alkaline phosphatase synthesis response regulator PhoP